VVSETRKIEISEGKNPPIGGRIPKKYAPVLFVFFVALTMSFLMSFALTLINLGFSKNFLALWLRSWMLAFPLAFAAALTVVPPIRKLVERLTDGAEER
jgi:hypothetical protein